MKKWTSIILAGGASSRMGQSKALLSYRKQPLIKYMVEILKPFSEKIIIVHRQEEQAEISRFFAQEPLVVCCTDHQEFRGDGPLAGFYTGIKTRKVEGEWYYLSACDLVYMDGAYLEGLYQKWVSMNQDVESIEDAEEIKGVEKQAEDVKAEALVPLSEGRLQPLAALYRPQVKRIEELLQAKERRFMSYVESLHICRIEKQEWSQWTNNLDPFFNMNSRADYEAVQREER